MDTVDVDQIKGFVGPVLPYDTPTVDGRMIARPRSGQARVRDLPIPMKWQRVAAEGHDNAITDLAQITRVWDASTPAGGLRLWGSGEFDLEDPQGREMARKVHLGYAGLASVDIGDFAASEQRGPNGQPLLVVTDFMLMSVTMVADAAMNGARVYTTTNADDITPAAPLITAQREAQGVGMFAAAEQVYSSSGVLTMRFGGRRAESSVAVTVAPAEPRVVVSPGIEFGQQQGVEEMVKVAEETTPEPAVAPPAEPGEPAAAVDELAELPVEDVVVEQDAPAESTSTDEVANRVLDELRPLIDQVLARLDELVGRAEEDLPDVDEVVAVGPPSMAATDTVAATARARMAGVRMASSRQMAGVSRG